MIQDYTTYVTISKLYKFTVEVEDGVPEDEDGEPASEPSHRQQQAVDAKLAEIEQSIGDYIGNEQDPELFINEPNAPPEVKSVEHCSGDDDWSLETNCD
jgi:hypothetical protein